MKRILLACNEGMSTSLLVERMKKHAKEVGIECEILAMSVNLAEKEVGNWDVCLIGPQVRYKLPALQKASSTPVMVINTKDYGLMDGAKVLSAALELINK